MDLALDKQSYSELRVGNFKSLGYYMSKAFSSNNTYTFISLMSSSILSFSKNLKVIVEEITSLRGLLEARQSNGLDVNEPPSGTTVAKTLPCIKLSNVSLSNNFFNLINTLKISLRTNQLNLLRLTNRNIYQLRKQINKCKPTNKKSFDMKNPQPFQSKR